MVLENLIVLANWGIRAALQDMADNDVFYYVIPFLLIFALVYAILIKSGIFGSENKGPIVVISLCVGALSLVGNVVPDFFQIVFAKAGVGLSLFLVALIFVGLFWSGDDEKVKWVKLAALIFGIIVFLVVMFSSMSTANFAGSWFWNEYGSPIVVLLLLGLIIWGITAGGSSSSTSEDPKTPKAPGAG
jgi:hypothetical protein